MDDLAPLHLVAGAFLANGAWLLPRRGPLAQLLCWCAAWLLWVALPLALLRRGGDFAPPAWEIWPVTLALFAVLAFPAIVWRHLRR